MAKFGAQRNAGVYHCAGACKYRMIKRIAIWHCGTVRCHHLHHPRMRPQTRISRAPDAGLAGLYLPALDRLERHGNKKNGRCLKVGIPAPQQRRNPRHAAHSCGNFSIKTSRYRKNNAAPLAKGVVLMPPLPPMMAKGKPASAHASNIG